jgi:hypothetical protein
VDGNVCRGGRALEPILLIFRFNDLAFGEMSSVAKFIISRKLDAPPAASDSCDACNFSDHILKLIATSIFVFGSNRTELT